MHIEQTQHARFIAPHMMAKPHHVGEYNCGQAAGFALERPSSPRRLCALRRSFVKRQLQAWTSETAAVTQ
ncbi:MAG TPA: hypothetical protein VNN62_01830 [Methylomirabilota bacterium]|nr:hypothetical protein [Methylomirabilota bacterium]